MKKTLILLLALLFASQTLTLSAKESQAKLKIYYYHATMRCEGCLQIEKFLNMALNELFEKEVKNGTIELKVLDFMLKEKRKIGKTL